MILLLAAVIALLSPLAPAAAAAPRAAALGRPCLLATADHRPVAALLASPQSFDCDRSPTGFHGPVTWALYDRLNLVNDPHDPLQFRFTRHRFADEGIYVRFADGRIVAAARDPTRRAHVMPSGILAYRLPPGSAPITAILVREDGMQNQRGIAPNANVLKSSVAARQDAVLMLIYALCCGAVLALFIYNLSLFFVLHYRFILAYCFSSLAVFLFGFSQSGAIFLLPPWLPPVQIEAVVLASISFYGVTIGWFMLSFIEHDRIGRPAARFIIAAIAVNCAASIVRLIDDTFAWQLVDRVYYASMAAVLLGLAVTTLVAMHRGSHAARFYLLVWTVPILFGVVRVFWGTGLIEEGGIVAEISPLFVLAFETLVSSLAVGWRIGQLRNERDEARGREQAFKLLSETDALTGLLNRRAFLERARDGTHVKRLILADIDRFKAVNDSHGHDVGDQVIQAVADAITGAAPRTALVGRIGGEEFAVLVDAAERDDVGANIRKAVAEAAMPCPLAITISVGVAEFALSSDEDWRELYNAADSALYRAKRNGRNRVDHAPPRAAA